MMDINGNKPEIYICTTNRSAGKTTFFSRYLVKRFLEYGEKFLLLYRYDYELTECADKFFREINHLFFDDYTMTEKRKCNGSFVELYLNKKSCGYCVSINGSEKIKKYSHYFSDVSRIMFDEFQLENGNYCQNEVSKFISIHVSIARGQGKQSRYVPVFMLGNSTSIINPYYTEMGISSRLNPDTKFLRGDGFVLEQGYNENAANVQKLSPFNRAFKNSAYYNYNISRDYLKDNYNFVDKISGSFKYLATIRHNNKEYAIKYFPDIGIIYCDDRIDKTFKYKISSSFSDHNIDSLLLPNSSFFNSSMRVYFEKGVVRFKSIECKEAFIKTFF